MSTNKWRSWQNLFTIWKWRESESTNNKGCAGLFCLSGGHMSKRFIHWPGGNCVKDWAWQDGARLVISKDSESQIKIIPEKLQGACVWWEICINLNGMNTGLTNICRPPNVWTMWVFYSRGMYVSRRCKGFLTRHSAFVRHTSLCGIISVL